MKGMLLHQHIKEVSATGMQLRFHENLLAIRLAKIVRKNARQDAKTVA